MSVGVTLAHMDLLERGCVFQKFHDRESRMEPRFMWVDFQDQRLYWCKEGQKVKLPNCGVELMELTRVTITKEPEFPIFDLNMHAKNLSEDLLLTLTFDHISQSLHLGAPNVDVRDQWLEAIDALMEEHEKQYQEYQQELEAQEHEEQGQQELDEEQQMQEEEEERRMQDEEELQSPPEPLPPSQPSNIGVSDDRQESKYNGPSTISSSPNFNNPRPLPASAAAAMIQQGDDELFNDDDPEPPEPYPAFAEVSRSSKSRAKGLVRGSNSIDDEYAAIEAEQAAMEAKRLGKQPSLPKRSRESPLDALFGGPAAEEKEPSQTRPKALTQLQKPAKQSKPSMIAAQPIQIVTKETLQTLSKASVQTAQNTPSVTRRGSRDGSLNAPPPAKSSAPPTTRSSKSKFPVYASKFDRAVLPNPMPREMRDAVQHALGKIVIGAYARIDAKKEDAAAVKKLRKQIEELSARNADLEDQLQDAEEMRQRMVELEDALAIAQENEERHDAEWNSLAIATQSESAGKIEIRLATSNLEHEAPHQYVGILYIKHPLEEAFEYSQSVSLMRSADGSTYLPKLTLSPTELFAFRHPEDSDEEDQEEDQADDEEDEAENGANSQRSNRSTSSKRKQKKSPSKNKKKKTKKPKEQEYDENGDPIEPLPEEEEGELVGAQLRLEIWDLINPRIYGAAEDEHGELESTGYQGHVDWDMSELIAANHHVMSIDIENDANAKKQRAWKKQGVKLVVQYCLPLEEDENAPAPSADGQPLSHKQLATGSTNPLLTLQLAALEEEIAELRKAKAEVEEDNEVYKDQSAQFTEERKVRLTLEQRLVQEQIHRVKQEQEVMRLKPRALELVDTTDELAAARRKIRDMEFTVSTLQKELRKQTLPPTPHAMLDELLSLTKPSLVDLLRVKKFILEQERVRSMLVEEMSASQKHYVTYETTHDELVRRENALHTHCHWLEDEKRKLEAQAAELTTALHNLQAQTLQLSKRCETAESEKELMHVNLSYLTDQQKLHRKKIDELERALLVHHGQLANFEYAKIPAPQQVQKQVNVELDDLPEEYVEEADDASAEPEMMIDEHGESVPVPGQKLKPKKRTKIVYSDALEQSLAAAGANWNNSGSG
jgi:hypothetical protein